MKSKSKLSGVVFCMCLLIVDKSMLDVDNVINNICINKLINKYKKWFGQSFQSINPS